MKNPLPMSEFINVKLSTTNLTLNSTQICMIPSSIMKKGESTMKNCRPTSLGRIVKSPSAPNPMMTKLHRLLGTPPRS